MIKHLSTSTNPRLSNQSSPNSGKTRSRKAKKNIVLTFILRSINVGTGIVLIPLVLSYLGQSKYGTWLILFSIVMWFESFDLGIGHGLRNNLSKALAKGNKKLALKLISTSYALISIISVIFFTSFILLNRIVDWSAILNTQATAKNEINCLVLIAFGCFSARLTFRLIYSIIYANQNPFMKEFVEVLGKLLTLASVFVLFYTTESSLFYLGACYSSVPIIVLIIFSIIYFSTTLKDLTPKLTHIDLSFINDLVKVGYKFFILQITAVVLFTTDNLIIAHLFSPADVPPYQIAQKYFGIVLIGFGIVVEPFWSAVTEAYVRNDIFWIKSIIKTLSKIWVVVVLVLFIMLLISNYIYQLWVGEDIYISTALSTAWAIFYAIQSINIVFIYFINGTGKLKLQMIHGVIAAMINIPLSILLAKNFGLGTVGVISATIMCQLVAVSLNFAQYIKIIDGEPDGLWGK